MKTYILLTSLFICSFISAQVEYWPTHPMDARIGNKPDVQPDTVISKDGTEDKWVVTYVHCYGDNGYIDTLIMVKADYEHASELRLSFAYLSTISTYSRENNKLISEAFYKDRNASLLLFQSFYEYDSLGRRTKEQIINFTDDWILKPDKTIVYDFSKVNYTDSGYIYNGVNYFFDGKKRLIKITTDYSIHAYTYFDSELKYRESYTDTSNEHQGKVEYFFDKNGLLTKRIGYSSDWNSGVKDDTEEYFYYFSPGNSTSNSFVANIPEIYGTAGSLIVNTEQPEWIRIYTLSGQLAKKEYVNQSKQIPLPKGIYIVKSTNKTYKVVIGS